jgi:hypothetical protein
VDKKKSKSQNETKSRNGSKNKTTQRTLSQTQKFSEAFDEHILDIDLKKPRRPFNFFIQEMFSKEGGKIDSKTMKDFGKKFKSINEKERNKFSDMAEKDKERYEEHLNLVHENLIKKPANEKKTGHRFFIDEQIGKALEKGEDASEARLKAAEKWNKMENDDREKYEKMSDKNKEFYEKLRGYKTGLSAYTLFSRDKMASAKEKGESLTIVDCAGLWKKSKDSVREKYEDYSKELKEEIEKNRDMVELTFNLKPTRPLSAYTFFMRDLYASGEVKGFGKQRQVAEKWEKLKDDDRAPYLKMAKKERLIYIIKKRNYDAMIRKDLGKAPSALNIFMTDNTGENMSLKDMYAKWKSSDKATKAKYQKKAADAKEEFQKKVEEFKSRVYDKPKRVLGAYNFFFKTKYKELRDENKDLEVTEMMKVVGEAYKKLSAKQLKVYEDMSNEDDKIKKEYHRQYNTFGYYIMEGPVKKRKPRAKKELTESDKEENSKKNKKERQEKTPTKSAKKGKKN